MLLNLPLLHRELANEMSEQERRNHTAINVHQFVTETEWKDWFCSASKFL